MKQFLITVAGVFFGMAVFAAFFVIVVPLLVIGGLAAAVNGDSAPAVGGGDGVVLELDLRQSMLDQPAGGPFAFVQAPVMLDVVRGLAAAEEDDRVAGLFIRANEAGIPAAHAQELREALLGFRQSGKFVIAHSQGFSSTSVLPYLAVSASDQIWLQQTAGFSATGLATEATFLGGTIEKYGAQSQVLQIAEYKTGANQYNESDFTPAHRESLTELLESVYGESLEMIARDRSLTADEVEALFEASPYTSEGAARAGLVDRVGHLVEAREAALERADGGRFVALTDYLAGGARAWDSGQRIALIGGQGEIVTGETWGQGNFLGGGDVMGSDTIARAFHEAAEDDSVRAIVFRIDSPGGSIVASEQIWHAVREAQEAGKPVVVSMGPLAASGGYYVAAPADAILALPGTLTGSIGIYGGKIVIDGALDLVGLNIEPLAVGGSFAGAYTSAAPFTDSQLAAVRGTLEDGYDVFTGHVAEGRDMPMSRVLEIARGRVWSGAQAHELGLVDEIGGLRAAIARAKTLGGLSEDDSVALKVYPAQPSPFEQFRLLFGAGAETAQVLGDLRAVAALPEVRAALDARRSASGTGQAAAEANLPAVR